MILRPEEFDPATSTLTVSLTATDYALQAIVLPFIARLRLAAPNMRVAVRPPEDNHTQQQLEKGEIDIAIVTTYAIAPDLHARMLYEERTTRWQTSRICRWMIFVAGTTRWFRVAAANLTA